MLNIGTLKLKNNIICAPMAGISDKVYRSLAIKKGAGLVCSEMISATALKYNPNPRYIMAIEPGEHPISMQLFGGISKDYDYAIKLLEEKGADIIDLNAGCPVPKVIKQNAGAYLLKEPKNLAEIISTMKKATRLPITVKVRLGWDLNSINIIEIAKIIENEGADAIIIHARTRSQGYTGKADWSYIRQIKNLVKIPVIGNGDVDSPENAKLLLTETGCEGIMVGRAAIGNPWLFREINAYLNNEAIPAPPSLLEKLELAYEHSEQLVAFKNEITALKEMRKFLIKYIKGMPNAVHYKTKLSLVCTLAELREIIDEIKSLPLE